MDADQIAKMIEEKFPGEVLGTVTHAGQTGVSVKPDFLREECERAKENPRKQNSFRRLHLNQWTEQNILFLYYDI